MQLYRCSKARYNYLVRLDGITWNTNLIGRRVEKSRKLNRNMIITSGSKYERATERWRERKEKTKFTTAREKSWYEGFYVAYQYLRTNTFINMNVHTACLESNS